MTSNTVFKRRIYGLVMLVLVAIYGCTNSGQMIAEGSIEDRIALLRVGETTKSDVERILGHDHDTDRNRWSNFPTRFTKSPSAASEREWPFYRSTPASYRPIPAPSC